MAPAQLLKSASRGKESTDALADLMVLCATSPTRVSLRNESVKLLYSILSEPQQGPFRLRLLCAQTLQTAAPSSVLTFAKYHHVNVVFFNLIPFVQALTRRSTASSSPGSSRY